MIIGAGEVLVAMVVMGVVAEGAVAADNSSGMGPKIIMVRKRIRGGRSEKSSNTLNLKLSRAMTPTSNKIVIGPCSIASLRCRRSEEVTKVAANAASSSSANNMVVTKMMPASKKR